MAQEEATEGGRRQGWGEVRAGFGGGCLADHCRFWHPCPPTLLGSSREQGWCSRPLSVGLALRALHSLLNLQNSCGVGGVLGKRPREIPARAGHSLNREAQTLNYHLPGDLELTRNGLYKLLTLN